jgi:hypothetical protein
VWARANRIKYIIHTSMLQTVIHRLVPYPSDDLGDEIDRRYYLETSGVYPVDSEGPSLLSVITAVVLTARGLIPDPQRRTGIRVPESAGITIPSKLLQSRRSTSTWLSMTFGVDG